MASDPVQAWLRAMNAHRFNVYVSVNAIGAGRRSRTRDAVVGIRHVFLEVDREGPGVLRRVEGRADLPSPSYVLHSSENRLHIFWRVQGFDADCVECLQKHLANELRTDPAATPITQTTRMPGYDNHKYDEPYQCGSSIGTSTGCFSPPTFREQILAERHGNRFADTRTSQVLAAGWSAPACTSVRCHPPWPDSMAMCTPSGPAAG